MASRKSNHLMNTKTTALCVAIIFGPLIIPTLAQSSTPTDLVPSPFSIGAPPSSRDITWRPAPHKGFWIETDNDWVILPRTNLYEVVPSMTWMTRNLPECGFKELTEAEAKGATGPYYFCPAGLRPFLVRAVYEIDRPGRFRVERKGNDLAVIYGKVLFQPEGVLQESFIVVNLDFSPDEIYNQSSGAW